MCDTHLLAKEALCGCCQLSNRGNCNSHFSAAGVGVADNTRQLAQQVAVDLLQLLQLPTLCLTHHALGKLYESNSFS